jgi:adenine/guanine phosphoribosyltransferase-like PRPP-binding protein
VWKGFTKIVAYYEYDVKYAENNINFKQNVAVVDDILVLSTINGKLGIKRN